MCFICVCVHKPHRKKKNKTDVITFCFTSHFTSVCLQLRHTVGVQDYNNWKQSIVSQKPQWPDKCRKCCCAMWVKRLVKSKCWEEAAFLFSKMWGIQSHSQKAVKVAGKRNKNTANWRREKSQLSFDTAQKCASTFTFGQFRSGKSGLNWFFHFVPTIEFVTLLF